jgi:hypothetical protein
MFHRDTSPTVAGGFIPVVLGYQVWKFRGVARMATSIQPRDTGGGDVGGRDSLSADVACDLNGTSTWTLRRLVRRLLVGHGSATVEDAVLVADELASNAIRHGEAPRRCRLRLLNQGRVLRIEVDDSGKGHPRVATPHSAGGRGLLLVSRLARWGVRRGSQFKTVWAEMDLDDRQSHSRILRLGSWSWPSPG